MDALKFVVLDEEDLEVASTHLQDAVVRISDVLWRPQESASWWRSTALTGRVRREPNPEYRRRRAALRFERVLSCKCRQINPARKDAVLNLLAVEFSETEAPSGVVMLTFSAGRRCGSMSNVWKPNWPISVHPGRPLPARHAEIEEPAKSGQGLISLAPFALRRSVRVDAKARITH